MKSLGFSEGAQASADINSPPDSLVKGSKVWVKRDEAWLAGELKSDGPPASLNATTSSSVPLMVQMADDGKVIPVDVANLAPANPKLQEGIPDLTHLSFLNEPGILFNLRHRYGSDGIYTFAGPVLIALNPCKTLPLYSKEVANSYKGEFIAIFLTLILSDPLPLILSCCKRHVAFPGPSYLPRRRQCLPPDASRGL